MATSSANQTPSLAAAQVSARNWAEFAYRGYARIVARKHGIPAPDDVITDLSDEELDQRLALLRDLAHLPPG